MFHFCNSYAIGRSILGVFHRFRTHILNTEQYYLSFTLRSLVHGESLVVLRVKPLLFVFWWCFQGFSVSLFAVWWSEVRCFVTVYSARQRSISEDRYRRGCSVCSNGALVTWFSKVSNVFPCPVQLSKLVYRSVGTQVPTKTSRAL